MKALSYYPFSKVSVSKMRISQQNNPLRHKHCSFHGNHYNLKLLKTFFTILYSTTDIQCFRNHLTFKNMILRPRSFLRKLYQLVTMTTGHFLKFLLYQRLISGPSSMFVPSYMVVSKIARFCHLFPGLFSAANSNACFEFRLFSHNLTKYIIHLKYLE